MPHTENAVECFFRAYERNINSGDIAALVSQFADVFFAVSPQGTQPVRASDFAVALPKRKQFFDSLGCQSTSLVTVSPTSLDTRYILTRTQWQMTFGCSRGEPKKILVDSHFIIDTGGDAFKIIFYLASRDIMEILKERGIAAGAA
jgi:hypothetical protein